MTCIVGVIQQEKVWIGGDSAGVAGLDVTVRKDPKVFKVGEFVIGCTSSFRMMQLLMYSFTPPKRHEDEDIFKYMCTGFVDAIRTCFRNGGYMEVDRSVEWGGCFLVGYRGRLFRIDSDYQVGESVDGFDSVGCGQGYALGALLAMDSTINAEFRVQKSLAVSAHFSAGVRPPFIVLST